MQFEVFIIVIVTMVTCITQGYSKLGERIDYVNASDEPLYHCFFVLFCFFPVTCMFLLQTFFKA